MRPTALLVCVVLVVLGGCLSGPVADSGPTTDTTTPTTHEPTTTAPETRTLTPQPTDRCGYGLTVNVATDDDIERVDRSTNYTDLSDARQSEFQRALNGTGTDLGDDLPETWASPVVVRYEGTAYYTVAQTC